MRDWIFSGKVNVKVEPADSANLNAFCSRLATADKSMSRSGVEGQLLINLGHRESALPYPRFQGRGQLDFSDEVGEGEDLMFAAQAGCYTEFSERTQQWPSDYRMRRYRETNSHCPYSAFLHSLVAPLNMMVHPGHPRIALDTPFDLREVEASGNFDVKPGASSL